MADVNAVPGAQLDNDREAGPVTIPAALAVAWDHARDLAGNLIEMAYGPDGTASQLNWQAWGPQVAWDLLEVLRGLDVMVPEGRPMLPAGLAVAPGDADLLAGLSTREAAELALRLGSAQAALEPLPAGTPDHYEQILAEITGLYEQAVEQAGATWRPFAASGPAAGPGQDPSATAASGPPPTGPGL